jgi:hypothetical protein
MAFGKFKKLADPQLTLVSGGDGQIFADNFMQSQGNEYNKALTANYKGLYQDGAGENYTALLQRSYKAHPDSPELADTISNLFALEKADPRSIAGHYDNPGFNTREQIARGYSSRFSAQNVNAAAALLSKPDLVIVAVAAEQMHGKPSARIAPNTIAITSGNLEITASDVLKTSQQPVDTTIKPQFEKPKGPGIDLKKAFPANTRGLSVKPPST